MLYIDANIFVFSILNTESYGSKAEAILQKIQRGEEKALTSVLTIDEVFWAVKKSRGIEKALEACQALLSFPNLEVVAANKETAFIALQIIEESRLDPRDAFHAATAIVGKADCMVSNDAHFDRVKNIKRRGL